MVEKEYNSLDHRIDGRGASVETAIELQFKELEIITREKLREGF